MKKIAWAIALFSTLAVSAQAQNNVLTNYYALKDALVAGNTNTASTQAALLNTQLEKDFPNQKVLIRESKKIMSAKKIDEQRNHFSALSVEMYTLAKQQHLSAEPVYYQYCPMKKSYWLSSRAAIENPYYGSSMLTCGKVTDTIK